MVNAERYKVVTDEAKRYVLGHNGKLLAPVDPNVLDKIINNGSPSIQSKIEEPEPGVPALRKKYPNMSDEERLLRYSYAGTQVDDMLAAGAMQTDYRYQTPELRLLQALSKGPSRARVYIQKKDMLIDIKG